MKKPYIFFLLAFFSLDPLQSQPWQSQPLGTDAPLFPWDVETVNDQVAWVGLWNGDFSGYFWNYGFSDNHFSRTTDGGQTWETGTYPFSGSGILSNISALDANVAWVSFVDFAEGNKVLRTTDGGQNWQAQNVPVSVFVNFVHFFDVSSGFVVGDPDAYGFEIFVSGNGGTFWQRIDTALVPLPNPGEAGIQDIYATQGNSVWFATNQGRVFHSADRGYSWEAWPAPTPPVNPFPDCIACQDGACIMSFTDLTTQTYPFQGYVYRTFDEGATWEDITPANNDFRVQGLHYIPGTGVLIASFISSNDAGPFETRLSYDDGATWTTIDEGTKSYKFDFVDGNTGYATEYHNNADPTVIFRYTGENLTGLLDPKPLQAEVSLFPNPTAGMFRLNVHAPQITDFLVLVNDAQGRLVRRERVEEVADFQRHVDLSGLAGGLYSVTVSGQNGMTSQKILKTN